MLYPVSGASPVKFDPAAMERVKRIVTSEGRVLLVKSEQGFRVEEARGSVSERERKRVEVEMCILM